METYLAHHGILGMKWGVRRYQNEDGTLTPAGKKRIANKTAKANRDSKYIKTVASSVKKSDDRMGSVINEIGVAVENRGKEYSKYRDRDIAKKAKTMSDDELKKIVYRMNLEKQYRNLSKEDRDAGADFIFNQSRETVKDVIAVAAPIVSAIVTPVITAKLIDITKKK